MTAFVNDHMLAQELLSPCSSAVRLPSGNSTAHSLFLLSSAAASTTHQLEAAREAARREKALRIEVGGRLQQYTTKGVRMPTFVSTSLLCCVLGLIGQFNSFHPPTLIMALQSCQRSTM
jgi:hypothetical protein